MFISSIFLTVICWKLLRILKSIIFSNFIISVFIRCYSYQFFLISSTWIYRVGHQKFDMEVLYTSFVSTKKHPDRLISFERGAILSTALWLYPWRKGRTTLEVLILDKGRDATIWKILEFFNQWCLLFWVWTYLKEFFSTYNFWNILATNCCTLVPNSNVFGSFSFFFPNFFVNFSVLLIWSEDYDNWKMIESFLFIIFMLEVISTLCLVMSAVALSFVSKNV